MDTTHSTTFSDMNADPIEAAEIMEIAGIHQKDLIFPTRFNRVKEIVKFFSGKIDKSSAIRRLIAGKNVDTVDHLYGYVELRKQLDSKMNEVDDIKQAISHYE